MPSFRLWLVFSCFTSSTEAIRQSLSHAESLIAEALNETISGSSAIEARRSFRERYHARKLEDLQRVTQKISYEQISIPSASEVAKVISHFEEEDCQDSVNKEILDFTMRFAALSYSRNSEALAQFTILGERENVPEVIEIQLHGTGDRENGAHAVVYLYKSVNGGAGVVLSFKGSTLNYANWSHNLKAFSSEYLLSGDARVRSNQPEREAAVHQGFLTYKRTLDSRMKRFSLQTDLVRDVLKQWGIRLVKGMTLYRWLVQGKWEWCLLVGHSLGGAMAQIAAAELSLRSRKQPFLATVGSPTAGNAKFAETLETVLDLPGDGACPLTRVRPGGGLRFYNWGDLVTNVGYLLVGGTHAGYAVQLAGRTMEWISPLHNHLCYTFESSLVDGNKSTLTLEFPGLTYNPVGFADMPLKHGKLLVISASTV